MSETAKKKRILWIDVAKGLGMFMIYLGHYGDVVGNGNIFVRLFHVPLFFFLSGCFSGKNNENNFLKFAWKRFKILMIPYIAFNILSIFIYTVIENAGTHQLKPVIIMALRGDIRNACVPYTLWFFSCLYVMELLFFWIKKLKFKPLILGVSFLGFVFIEGFMTPPTGYVPNWFMNADSALYFLFYYALGYCAFPYITKLFELDSRKKHIIFWVSGLIASGYAAYAFEGRDGLMPLMKLAWVIYFVSPLLRGMILIYFTLFLAKLLEKIPALVALGQDSLYLCGNEYIIKEMFRLAFSIVQIDITLQSPASAYILTVIVMYVAMKALIPCEKKVVGSMKAYLNVE